MDEKVAQFVSITNASDRTAAFYLESCSGLVEAAVQSFFDNGGAEAPAPTVAAPAPGGSSLLAEAAAARAARAAAGSGDVSGAGAGPSSSRPAGGGRSAAANVRSLGDIAGGDEDEDDDDFNDYYVGGDKSGQLVRGAPKDKDKGGSRPQDRVEGIFEGAKAAGAEQGSYEDMLDEEEGGGRFKAFSGSARTLEGGEMGPPQGQEASRGPQRRVVKITFYANGIFTVDDGEPRSMSDPSNLPFMEAIMRGQLPPELDPGDPNIMVNVNLLRREGDYTPPAQPKVKAFSGTGYKLSGGDEGASTSFAGPPPSGGTSTMVWAGADPTLPTTSIQLRLADGSRVRAEFNLTHTVADIRSFISASRPDMAARPYRLATAFPQQQLDDDSVTIEGAGLANSVVVQKM